VRDFATAVGLVFAIEGLLLAAFPAIMRRSMYEAASRPESWLRNAGIVGAVAGVVIIWLVRTLL
jgi:uncharacterized protein